MQTGHRNAAAPRQYRWLDPILAVGAAALLILGIADYIHNQGDIPSLMLWGGLLLAVIAAVEIGLYLVCRGRPWPVQARLTGIVTVVWMSAALVLQLLVILARLWHGQRTLLYLGRDFLLAAIFSMLVMRNRLQSSARASSDGVGTAPGTNGTQPGSAG